jgi:hypothetical protein
MKKSLLFGMTLALAGAALLPAQTQAARIRVVHASPDAPGVDILVNGARVIENLPFREYTEYLSVPAGTYSIQVNVTGTSTTVLQASPALAAGRDYTALALGYAGGKSPSLRLKLLEDDNALPSNGNIKVRVVHGAPGAPEVDVYVTTPFETLDGKTPALSSVPFDAASGYLTVPISTYQARVAVAGTKTIAIDSHRLVTWNQMIRTIVAVDNKGGGAPFDLLLLPDRN